MDGLPLDALVLPHQLGGVGEVRVLVVDVRVSVMADHVLVVPHPGRRQPGEEVRKGRVNPPVAAHAKVESIVPVVGNDDPSELGGCNKSPPASRDEVRDGRKEGSHETQNHGPSLGGCLGGLPERDPPRLGNGREVVLNQLLDVEGEFILFILVPDIVCTVVPWVNHLEGFGNIGFNLVLIEDTIKSLMGHEVVVRLKECGSIATLRKV